MLVDPFPLPAEAGHRRCGEIRITTRARNAEFIRCVARHADVPGGPKVAVAMGDCESDLDWRFLSEDYGGTFSGHRDYWPGRVRTYLGGRVARRVLAKPHDGITRPKPTARVHLRFVASKGTWRHDFPTCSRKVGAP